MEDLIVELNAGDLRSRLVRVFSRIEGNSGCFNDVIVLSDPNSLTPPKFNVVYFGGDVQVK